MNHVRYLAYEASAWLRAIGTFFVLVMGYAVIKQILDYGLVSGLVAKQAIAAVVLREIGSQLAMVFRWRRWDRALSASRTDPQASEDPAARPWLLRIFSPRSAH